MFRSFARGLATALLAGVGLGGCATSPRDVANGSAELVATTSQALDAAQVTRVTLTITGLGINTPVVRDLTKTGGAWQALIGELPAGTDRVFSATAFDAAGVALFEGSASGVNITKNQTVVVALLLQQRNAPSQFQNHVPAILSVTLEAAALAPQESISVSASAFDVEDGTNLHYAWSASAGAFSDPLSAAPSWTAPATEGPVTLQLSVTDSNQALAAMTFQVDVAVSHPKGSSGVVTTINRWPAIQGVTASPTEIDGGESTQLDVTASDDDGDTLGYAWSSDCAGVFSDPSARSPVFTLDPALHGGSCTLTVEVRDFDGAGLARGGHVEGATTIALAPAPNAPPVIAGAAQSRGDATSDDVVQFSVHGFDPEGTPVTYAWSASSGVVTSVNGTDATWSPAVGFTGTATIEVTLTDGTGLSTSQPFVVTVTPAPVHFIRPLAGTESARIQISGDYPYNSVFSDPVTGHVYFAPRIAGMFTGNQIQEYADVPSFIARTVLRVITLPTTYYGTYHVAIAGHVYYADNTGVVRRVRLSDGAIVAAASIPGAGVNFASGFAEGGWTDIDLFVDRGNRLYVLYAASKTAPTMQLSLLDPISLALSATQNIPFSMGNAGYAFLVNGVMYFGFNWQQAQLNAAYVIAENRWDASYTNAMSPTLPGCETILHMYWDPSSHYLFQQSCNRSVIYASVQ